MTNDELSTPSISLPSLHDLIVQSLPWSIRRIAYPHQGADTIAYIEMAVHEICKRQRVLDRLEARIKFELWTNRKRQPEGHWLQKLAQDQSALVKAGSLASLVGNQVSEAVQQSLAQILHELENHSAIAALCHTPSDEETLWLDAFFPEDFSRCDNEQLPATSINTWGVECLPLSTHCLELSWNFSAELLQHLRARKPAFVELHKCPNITIPWETKRAISMKQGLCLQFVADSPLLRRVALLHCIHGARQNDGSLLGLKP